MKAFNIHAFMREKGLKAAVAILLAAAMRSPVAAGIVVAVFFLPTLSLKRLLRPSKWPWLSVCPYLNWGTIIFVVLALFHAWLYTPAAEILTCTVIGDLFFCWEWLRLMSRTSAGVYLLLVAYDHLQYHDICDPGTEVLITRIEKCRDSGQPSTSWIVHSTVELDDKQLRRLRDDWRCTATSPPFLFEGAWYKLCLQSVHFLAESDGTRTRCVSTCTPELDRPIEFTSTRSCIESTELCFSMCPVAMGLTLFALHGAILWTGVFNHFLRIFLVWFAFHAWSEPWLGSALEVEPFLEAFADFLFKVCLCGADSFLFGFGVFSLANASVDFYTMVCGFSALALSCFLLRILAEVPDIGPPIKCTASSLVRLMRSFGRFVVPTVAKLIKAGLATLALVGVLLSAPFAVAVALVVTVAVPVRVRMLVVVGAGKAISGLLVSPERRPAILKSREARLKYRCPKLVPLVDARNKVGPDSAGVSSCRVVPSKPTGASDTKRRMFSRRGQEGRPSKKTVAAHSQKGGVVLGALASSVAPVRRSLRLAVRVARSTGAKF
jgi:hypothetical protein